AERGDLVANRLRSAHKKATVISIHISYSRTVVKKSINAQKKIDPANLPKTMVGQVLELFRKKYTSGAVRQSGVS
ncbi:DNA polymerase, partial [Streptococcus suis]